MICGPLGKNKRQREGERGRAKREGERERWIEWREGAGEDERVSEGGYWYWKSLKKEVEKDVKEGPFDKFKEVSFLGFVWMKQWGEFDSYNHL